MVMASDGVVGNVCDLADTGMVESGMGLSRIGFLDSNGESISEHWKR